MSTRRSIAAMLTVGASLVAFTVSRFYPLTLATAQTSATKTNVVSYFVEWHGTAYSPSSGAALSTPNWTENINWESTGSAIVRYDEQGPEFWTYRDSKLLNLVASFNFMSVSTNGACGGTDVWSESLLDSGLDGVPIMLWNQGTGRALKAGARRVSLFFQRAPGRAQLQKHKVDGCGSVRNEIIDDFPGPDFETNDIRDAVNSPFDLLADKDDMSSFSVHNQFKSHLYGREADVDWSAHAYRMGKCSERQGPIADEPGLVDHHEVAIQAVDHEISPDGKTQLKISVKCDGVPVSGVDLDVKVEPEALTGGHHHSSERPRGLLNGTELTDTAPSISVKTGTNGEVDVKFEPPRHFDGRTSSKTGGIGGDYKVTATSKRLSSSSEPELVTVRFSNLESLPDNANYEICASSELGYKPGQPGVGLRGLAVHPDGMWGTPQTIAAFTAFATDFLNSEQAIAQGLHNCGEQLKPIRKVSINDIALPQGGKFDLKQHWGKDWHESHQTHGAGLGGDFNHFKETGTFTDCVGYTEKWEDWWMDVFLSLGQQYGHWDQYDQTLPGHELHLHVGD